MGFSDAEITAGLADLTVDVEDTVATKKLQAIYTADEAKGSDAIFGDIKKTAKAQALNPIDEEFKLIEELLSPEEKAAYVAAGANTYEKQKIVNKAFKEAKTKSSGDPNFDALKTQFTELQGKLTSDYVEKGKYDAATEKLIKAQQDNLNFKVITSALNEVKDEGKKKDKHFQNNFLSDFRELVEVTGVGPQKIKGKIDYETGKIMRADNPEQPLMIGADLITVESVIPLVASSYNTGFTPPPADPLRIPNPGPGADPTPQQSAAFLANQKSLNDELK